MKFREYSPNQVWLIPPNIEEEIPEDDIVRVISRVIDELSVEAFEGKYKEVGNIAYNPRLMLKIILYSYQQGIFSSRKMEQAAERNIYYWYLTGKQCPNFRTLCKFIKRHQDHIEDIFSQVLWICQKEGLINLDTVSIDGSTIKANASKEALWDEDRVHSELRHLKAVASNYLKKHIERDELERQLEEEQHRLKTTKKKSIDSQHIASLLTQVKKVKSIEKQLKSSGRKKVNTTDPDACLNGKKGKPKEMCYHSNIVVEGKNQIIVSADVDGQLNEHLIVENQIEAIQKRLNTLPRYLLGDSAYARLETIHYLNTKNIRPVIPEFQIQHIKSGKIPSRNTSGLFSESHFHGLSNPSFICCPTKHILKRGERCQWKGRSAYYIYSNPKACHCCPVRSLCTKTPYRRLKRSPYYDEMKEAQEYIKSPKGYEKYKQRIGMVEPVFANIKWNKGFKYTLRGLKQVKSQFKLMCIAHNLEKLARIRAFLPYNSLRLFFKYIFSRNIHSFSLAFAY